MSEKRSLTDKFEKLYEIIEGEDVAALTELFVDGKVSANVPRYGQIGNNVVFGRYLKKVKQWLDEREGLRFEYWGAVGNEERLAVNMVFYFEINDEEFDYHKTLHIPVSFMCELEGDRLRTVRVYYCTMWIAGHNMVRPAMLNEDPAILESLPASEQLYFKSLWAGDSKPIMELFEPDAYFMGTAYSFNQGPDLIKTFSHLFEGGKNTELRICSAFTTDNYLCIEYMNHRSGGNPNTPSAGMAIYGFSPRGKLAFVRLAGDSLFDHCLWPTL